MRTCAWCGTSGSIACKVTRWDIPCRNPPTPFQRPRGRRAYSPSVTAARLVNPAPAVSKSMNNQKLLEIFQADANLPAVAVLNEGLPVGIVNRRRFLERFTLPYYPEVYGRKSCTTFMESNPLLIEISQPLEELIHVL